jgi:hypothetical protein
MNFVDLYRRADAFGAEAYISVRRLRDEVQRSHPHVNEIIFYKCDLDIEASRGHMVLYLDRSSPYDEEFIVSSIRYSKHNNRCWRRFVCCKELMHSFDPSLSRTSNREKFIELLNELENNPVSFSASNMYQAERTAEWQALFALCPKSLRKKCLELQADGKSPNHIAGFLGIPEVYLPFILGERYEKYHEFIVGEPI